MTSAQPRGTTHRDGRTRIDLAFAHERDSADPLASFRERFYLPPDGIYLDGNSLGPLSRDAEASVLQALHAWRTLAIDGWMGGERPWYWIGERLGALEAELVGARPEELVVTGSITTNLHALLATFYRPVGKRTKIIADALDFPSDIYALQSWLRLRFSDPADHLVLVPSRDGRSIDEDDVVRAMDAGDASLVWLPSVLYRSGQWLDMERLTREAHSRGLLIGFDCAHSAGSVPHALHDWGVDFALWCNYKYLNAGPGAVGSLYVHERHFGTLPGLTGWWGCDKERQFEMSHEFHSSGAAGAWQISTPSVLGAAALYGSLAMFAEAGIDRLRAKSLALTDYVMQLVDRRLASLGVIVGTPREPGRRGGHVALEHPQARRLAQVLQMRGVVTDFREPNIIRLAPVALYTTYADVWNAIEILHDILASGAAVPTLVCSTMDKHESASKLLMALKAGTPEAFDAVALALAPKAFIMAPVRGEASGREAVIQNLKEARPAGVVDWEGPTDEPRGVRIIARTPGGPVPGITWLLTFDADGQIAQVLESRLRAAPSKPDPLRITETMAAAINGAMDNGTPTVLGYVNEQGEPRLSFRGTTQAYSEDQLAVWARYEDAGLPTAIQKNPHVSVVYYARGSGNLIFEGRARIDNDPAVRDHVFDHSPVVEQRADPERNGVAIVIDIDKVTGRLGGERVNMARTG